MITCGIDIGSTTIEVVLLRGGEPIGSGWALCGPAPAANTASLQDSVLSRGRDHTG